MVRSLLLIVLAVAASAAESPKLEATVQTENGHAWVILRNVSRIPAVAYNCVAMSTAGGKHRPATRWIAADELFDLPGTARIEPGGELTVPLGADRTAAAWEVRAAVLYGDGTSAGEPDDVRRLLDVREATVADIPKIQSLIRSAGDVGGLRLELERLRKQSAEPPKPVLRHGTSREDRQNAQDFVRLHYAGSQLPAAVLRWLDETSDKQELLSRIDRLRGRILQPPQQ